MDTVGKRIRSARESLREGRTQEDFAGNLNMSRSGVAAWERDESSPPLNKLEAIAAYLKVDPHWLAFGETQVGADLVTMPEIRWVERDKEEILSHWGLHRGWLQRHARVQDVSNVALWRVRDGAMAPLYVAGDRIILDRAITSVSGNGIYLIWNGIGPSLNRITGISMTIGEAAKVTVSALDPHVPAHDIAAADLIVLGRSRGLIRAGDPAIFPRGSLSELTG